MSNRSCNTSVPGGLKMRRWLWAWGVILTALSVGVASAAPKCKPLKPKKWSGQVRLGAGGFITTTFFERGDCSWNGLEAQMNGLDAIVFDISTHAGLLATVSTRGGSFQGYFLTAECEREAFWGPVAEDKRLAVRIPKTAQWVLAFSGAGTAGAEITVQAKGRTCKKKKKNRKNRRRAGLVGRQPAPNATVEGSRHVFAYGQQSAHRGFMIAPGATSWLSHPHFLAPGR